MRVFHNSTMHTFEFLGQLAREQHVGKFALAVSSLGVVIFGEVKVVPVHFAL